MDDVVVMVTDMLRAALARQQDRSDARAVLDAAVRLYAVNHGRLEECVEHAVDALVMARDKLVAAADLPESDPHGDVKFSGLVHGNEELSDGPAGPH